MSQEEKWHELIGRTVLITGAAGQLGTALARGFQESGARVFGFDLSPSKDSDLFDGFATGDISKKSDVLAAYEQLLPEDGAFDILVNNAGITTATPFAERTEEEFDKVYSVNVKGSFFCAQEFLKRYKHSKRKNGAIVNIGSIYGVMAPDFRIYTDYGVVTPEVYGISKAGMLQMTRYLAALYARKGLRVNSVSPGGIFNRANPQGDDFVERYSDRVPMRRMAEVEEIVPAVVFLSGKGASYITGQNLLIDGGLSCW
ncbi:SDR family oxidoreductase [Verrucomicrobia bacterium]|nr:SDR family oxidoreductase [Verrucomicrobiota bacterium]